MFKFLKKIFSKVVSFLFGSPKKPTYSRPVTRTEETKTEAKAADKPTPKATVKPTAKPEAVKSAPARERSVWREAPVEPVLPNDAFSEFTFNELVAHLNNLTDREVAPVTEDKPATETPATVEPTPAEETEEKKPTVTSNAKVARPPRRDRNAARKRKKGY